MHIRVKRHAVSNVYLLPGLLATELERAGESKRERKRVSEKTNVVSESWPALNGSKTCTHAHTHTLSHISDPEAVCNLTDFCLQHLSSKESLQGVSFRLSACSPRQREAKQTTSKPDARRSIQHSSVMNSTINIFTTESSFISTETSHNPHLHTVQQLLQTESDCVCPLPLSCMTTPKCVLGVLSSGALGAMEMTGGLDGFLFEVVLFSEGGEGKAGNEKKQGPRGLQGYQFQQTHMEQLRMLALKSKISSWLPELFQALSGRVSGF